MPGNGAEVNNRLLGAQKEEEVCARLLSAGVRIVERNFRCRQGEIDVIGYDRGYLVFFEVKFRSTQNKGNAAQAVGPAKQRKICRVADYYRYLHRCPEDTAIRFDVVAVDGEEINWIRDAFSYIV